MSRPIYAHAPSPTQVISLYRRFFRLKLAIKHCKLDAYSYRYSITGNYPPVLRDIIHLNTTTTGTATYPLPGRKAGFIPNNAFHNIFTGWSSIRTSFVKTLDKMIPLFFRNTLYDPAHQIYEQSAKNHAELNRIATERVQQSGIVPVLTTPAQPISSQQLYQLGVRTLYFFERAMGLRPYVCYVEYGKPPHAIHSQSLRPATTTSASPTQTQQQQFSHVVADLTHSPYLKPKLTSAAPLPTTPYQQHKITLQLPSFLQPSKHSIPASTTTNPGKQSIVVRFNDSPSQPQSTRSTQSFVFSGIRNNRQRHVKSIIPLSADPKSLHKIPEKDQAVLYTIHQYFSTLEAQLGPGIKLTGTHKRAILVQLDPQYKELLTNSFILNPHYRLEERLLQCITRGNYFTVGFQNTVPLIIQRYQLMALLKELQLIVV